MQTTAAVPHETWLRRVCRRIGPHLRQPKVDVALGSIVLLVGLSELLEDTVLAFMPWLEIHHGLLVFGAVTSLRGLIDVVEGADRMIQAEERD